MKLHEEIINTNHHFSRIFYIDLLRGLAIFFMIFLHTSVYYLNNKNINTLFNLADFVNVVFIFCSCYVYLEKNTKKVKMFNWFSLNKRLLRLITPYYIFLVFYFSLIFLTERASFTFINIIKHITMWNGIYISWLVILFIIFSFLNPIIFFLKEKNKTLFYLFFLLSLLSSIVLLFIKAEDFAYILWVPYLLTIYYSIWIRHSIKSKIKLFATFVILSVMFIILFVERNQQNLSPLLINKYPPNIYYLLYSFIVVDIFFLLNKFNLIKENWINTFFIYLGKHSYDLFFVHILIIYILNKSAFFIRTNWITSFIIVLLLSSAVQLIMRILVKRFDRIRVSIRNN